MDRVESSAIGDEVGKGKEGRVDDEREAVGMGRMDDGNMVD